jgi:hypothetical protein
LRSLYYLSNNESEHNISLNVFGGDQPFQSRCFTLFIRHIYRRFRYLVLDDLEYWYNSGYMEESKRAISKQMEAYNGCLNTDIICSFIDTTGMRTSIPGGGAIEHGRGAQRYPYMVRQVFFTR